MRGLGLSHGEESHGHRGAFLRKLIRREPKPGDLVVIEQHQFESHGEHHAADRAERGIVNRSRLDVVMLNRVMERGRQQLG